MNDIQTSNNRHAVRPTANTLFLRRFLPWQIIRFLVINIKMTFMIIKSHDHGVKR